MNKSEFFQIRQRLGKTQKQMAQLLGVSIKTIQSFEQGWRRIPIHTERQSLLLLALKQLPTQKDRPCWLIKKCPMETRKNCPAWEFRAGHLCWCINGTICQGNPQKSWKKKIEMCRQCSVFAPVISSAGTRTV